MFPLFAGHDGQEERQQAGTAGLTCARNWEAEVGPAYFSFDWGSRHFVLYPNEEALFSAADQARKSAWLEADLAFQPAGRENRAAG